MEAHVLAEAPHSGGPSHTGWIFKTKEDWVAEKELLKEEHNFDMATQDMCRNSSCDLDSWFSVDMKVQCNKVQG